MVLHIIVSEFMQPYESKNMDDLFNSEFIEKSFFCIIEIISRVREDLDCLTYFGIICKL